MSQAKKITKKSTQVAGDDLVQQIFLDFESFEGDATDAKALGEEAWDLIIKLRIAQLCDGNLMTRLISLRTSLMTKRTV